MSLTGGLFAASIAGGLIDTFMGASSASKNYRAQMKALEWQKEAQKTTWEREDNAIQRRVKDLRAAGMSPVLAAGQGAQSSGPIQVTAPQYQKNWSLGSALDKASTLMSLMQGKQNIAVTEEQRKLVELQQDALKIENAKKARDLKIMEETGLSSDPSPIAKMGRDAYLFANQVKSIVQGASNFPDSINVPGLDKARETARIRAEEKRANEAKKAHEKYYKEYADRQAYKVGSRRSFSR